MEERKLFVILSHFSWSLVALMSFLGLWFRMNRCFVIRRVYVTKFYKERGQINIKVKSSFENDTVVHNKN